MSEALKYTAVVVGAGPGGYPCAIRLGQLGVKTLCIEKEYWGGVCLNVGCIPSKALITAGKKYEEIDKLSVMGIDLPTGKSLDMGRLQAWKSSITKKLAGGVQTLLKGNGVEMMYGTATPAGPGRLSVETANGVVEVEYQSLVLATGSRPIQVPGFDFRDGRILDSTKALDLTAVPARLVVIGGGYIGLELGQMLNKVGSKVTVVEMMDQVLPGFDADVVKLISRKLKKSGIDVLLQSKALGWEEGENGAVVRLQTPDGEVRVEADAILVTVGRRPNSEGLAEALGINKDGRGHIIVDNQLKTNVPGIYAIGDVATGIMLAHKATHEGEICAEVIAGHRAFNEPRNVPAVVFTDPEIATAGMQEHEAIAAGYTVKVGKVPYAAIARALTLGDSDGFYKVILDAADDRVLGVTICGHNASDLISECSLAVEMDAEALDLGLTIHPHPTLGEGVMEAAKAAIGQAVHILNK
jgi:dihydrolipoamide dehydrogenase